VKLADGKARFRWIEAPCNADPTRSRRIQPDNRQRLDALPKLFFLCALPHRPRIFLRTFWQREQRKFSMTLRSIIDIRYQEMTMNKDQIKGRVKEATGKAKEVTGRIVDDKDLEEEGVVESTIGKVQAGYGDLKADLKKVIKNDS
jgi:uncharacterized protein YjbJ (UPF0337 family)